MRLVSYFGPEDAGTGLLVGDRVDPAARRLPDAASTSTRRRSTTSRRRAAALDGRGRDPARRASSSSRRSPIPGKIVCVGLNYHEHVAEGGRPAPDPAAPVLEVRQRGHRRRRADRPAGGHRTPSTSRSSSASSSGSTARRVAREDALDHVAGYVVVNDVSARDWQGVPAALAEGEVGDGQWLRAKGSDTFLPMGSVFVTADEIPDPQALRLRSWRIPGSGPGRRHARS